MKCCSFLGVVICERSLHALNFMLMKNHADEKPKNQFELMIQLKTDIIKSANILAADC
jgi:hypothetical protein